MASLPANLPFPLASVEEEAELPHRGPRIRYPSGPVTPHGAYHFLKGRVPVVRLTAYDYSVTFDMMGGPSIPDRYAAPESVKLVGLKGLVPPWEMIDQKGATQDGVTFIDALYGPTEVEAIVNITGRDPEYFRQVHGHLIASIDAKKQSELSWWTQRAGRWWAPVRWNGPSPDPVGGINTSQQTMSLNLRADNAFWQSYPDIADFRFSYAAVSDDFDTDQEPGIPGWTLSAYIGTGGGYVYTEDSELRWRDDPDDLILTGGRRVTARKDGYVSATNNQVVENRIGSFSEWSFPENAHNDLWGRMNNTGTPGLSGVRARIGNGWVRLSYFVAGVETVMRESGLLIPAIPGEWWSLVCGFEEDERLFKILRNGIPVMSAKENGTSSPMGVANRSAGLGMHAGAALLTQATPADLKEWRAGDNSTISQSGFLTLHNAGDQDMYHNYTCYGPGIFRIADGPDSTEYVEFGPLLPNQVMYLRTDPRKRGVIDMTSIPPSPQQLDFFMEALKDFISFATAGNVPPLLQEIQSWFGIVPPQGNPYTLLKGRFSKPIPPKSPGDPIQPYKIAVSIDDGNSDSKIVANGTPLRRIPY
jgi:hypothetical protein